MAPTDLRRRFVKLIERERRRAEAGQPAEITAKMNSLIDEEIIRALYAASQKGVQIRLNVRGICALRPGIPGVSETIDVISIVDRFLEHSRVYSFLNGGDEAVYLASADWMTRNMDKRIELMFPIEDPGHKAAIMHALRSMFRDTTKARRLGADGVYTRVAPSGARAALPSAAAAARRGTAADGASDRARRCCVSSGGRLHVQSTAYISAVS